MVELTVPAAVVGHEPFLWRILLEAAHAGDLDQHTKPATNGASP